MGPDCANVETRGPTAALDAGGGVGVGAALVAVGLGVGVELDDGAVDGAPVDGALADPEAADDPDDDDGEVGVGVDPAEPPPADACEARGAGPAVSSSTPHAESATRIVEASASGTRRAISSSLSRCPAQRGGGWRKQTQAVRGQHSTSSVRAAPFLRVGLEVCRRERRSGVRAWRAVHGRVDRSPHLRTAIGCAHSYMT